MTFKIGDKVKCIDTGRRGSGWKLGSEFTIVEITNTYINGEPIYWKGENGAGVYESSLELVSYKFKVGDKVTFIGNTDGHVPDNYSCDIPTNLLVRGTTYWNGNPGEVVGIHKELIIVRYQGPSSDARFMQLGFKKERLELLSSPQLNNIGGNMATKYVFQVLTVNRKTGEIDKDETVVAADERQAILKAYKIDVENLAFEVTKRSEFTEDKPQTVIVDKGSK